MVVCLRTVQNAAVLRRLAQGDGIFPLKTEIKEKKTAAWCACKHSKAKPFCDGSHKSL